MEDVALSGRIQPGLRSEPVTDAIRSEYESSLHEARPDRRFPTALPDERRAFVLSSRRAAQ
jgi:hypothetical protein